MKGNPSAREEDPMSSPSHELPVNPLRRRMLEDMAMRGLREETQRDYIRFVRSFAAFLGRAPDTATHVRLGVPRRGGRMRRPFSIAPWRRKPIRSPRQFSPSPTLAVSRRWSMSGAARGCLTSHSGGASGGARVAQTHAPVSVIEGVPARI